MNIGEIVNIGVDCIELDRFKMVNRENIKKKIFTENEDKYCSNMANPNQHYAGKFTCKEAVIKAFSYWNISLKPRDIEVLNDEEGRPYVILHKDLKKDYIIKTSISHSNTMAIAYVLVILDDMENSE